ncbi:MAG: rubrerythrin family protein [Flavobacteriaceae bacterium]|nr:rubrerythrin family protein [Flavobacteriaceae bacterium]
MKKSIIILMFIASISGAIFQSCTGKAAEKNELQKPVAEAKEVSVEDAAAATLQNLQAAFKGETTASAKYAAYSKKAEEEGFHEIAMLYHAASTAENIHANNHKVVLEEAGQSIPEITPEFTVKSTKENLKDAIEGESYESNKMYPEFMITAKAAKNELASISLNYAYRTELKHLEMYKGALAALESNNVKSLPTVYFICPTCGNTYQTTTPKRCGISMTSTEKFIKLTKLS